MVLLSSLVSEEFPWDKWNIVYKYRRPSCHPVNSIRALQDTSSVDS